MPTISRFKGIQVRMYYFEHPPPHFHIRYSGIEAAVEILSGKVLEGTLPVRIERLIKKWTRQNRRALDRNWILARWNKPLLAVSPLE